MSSKSARAMAVQGFRSQRYPPPSRVFIPPNTPSTTPRNRYTSGSHPSRARELKNGGMEKANATLQQILANSGFLSRPAELLGSAQ